MQGDRSTAPVRPPPGPLIPGDGLLGPAVSPQQELASLELDSSKLTISSPLPARNAGEPVISGTYLLRKPSMPAKPPGRLGSAQVASWPSAHESGVMNT